MKPAYLYRNTRASELLELFLVSAAFSLLGTRFYLELMDYPSIGGSSLHIAHMLPGGLLMVAGMVVSFSFLGSRAFRLASVLGGLGFGLFIDELGKFVTRDNNYFFQPTVAIIYLVFISLFMLFRALSRRQRLTEREYLLNALAMMEESVINDLDVLERSLVLAYLSRADQSHPMVPALRKLMEQIRPLDTNTLSVWRRFSLMLERRYRRLITSRAGTTVLEMIFIAKGSIFFVTAGMDIAAAMAGSFSKELVTLYWLQLISSTVSVVLVVAGVILITRNRARAYEMFSRSLLIDIFITQFFAFYRNEFSALPGFILNALLYVGLRYIMNHEQRASVERA